MSVLKWWHLDTWFLPGFQRFMNFLYCNVQGCNFMKFSRGHVGPWTKNFRSPQENLRAQNEIRFIEEKCKRKSARHDVDHRILVNVCGFSGPSGNHAHTSTFSTSLVLFENVNNTTCSGDCFGIWKLVSYMHITFQMICALMLYELVLPVYN